MVELVEELGSEFAVEERYGGFLGAGLLAGG